MEIEFESDDLAQLYEGKSLKKYQPAIIKAYIKTVVKLKAANRIEDLYQIKSLNFEALSGGVSAQRGPLIPQ